MNIYLKNPIIIFVLCIVLGLGKLSWAREIAQSGPEQVSLIEVYTSEGCSSCVGAWKWLAQLQKDKELWISYVPIDFRVEYWDYLGWKDVLANPEYTDRQRKYAARWQIDSIYTPGFVLNGKEWRQWHEQNPSDIRTNNLAGNLVISAVDKGKYSVVFEPHENNKNYVAHFVLLGSKFNSDVKRGENRGKLFKHNFAVVDYKVVAMTSKKTDQFEASAALIFPDFINSVQKGIAFL